MMINRITLLYEFLEKNKTYSIYPANHTKLIVKSMIIDIPKPYTCMNIRKPPKYIYIYIYIIVLSKHLVNLCIQDMLKTIKQFEKEQMIKSISHDTKVN